MTRSAEHPAGPATRTGLRPEQLVELRQMLEQQQRFRVEQLAALGSPGSTGPLASDIDEITRSLATGARAALADVRDALARMDTGRYGRCTTCSTSVPVERLEILPQVAQCMPCQRRAEQPTSPPPGVLAE